MKKLTLIIFYAFSISFSAAQSWSFQELQTANTAKDISILTQEEKEVIKYLNLARMYPQKFAEVEVKNYYGPQKWGDYLKNSSYRSSLLGTLQYKRPVGPLYFDEKMYSLANCFAIENGSLGITGHTRINCPPGYEGECISYGLNNAIDIVLQLLIDHNVPSLGHREICLNGEFSNVGLSIKTHKKSEFCCVLDFKRTGGNNSQYFQSRPYNKGNNAISENTFQGNNSIQDFSTSTKVKTKKYKSLSIKIGKAANISFDNLSSINQSLDNYLAYQLNTMCGLIIGKSRKNTSFNIFTNSGSCPNTTSSYYTNSPTNLKAGFFEIEGGFLFGEFLRLSAGKGFFTSKISGSSPVIYTSATAGISLGPKWIKLDFANTFILRKNNSRLLHRPSAGVSIVLNMIKK